MKVCSNLNQEVFNECIMNGFESGFLLFPLAFSRDVVPGGWLGSEQQLTD